MLPAITLPNGRNTTTLGFGCASLMRLPEAGGRQRLLDLAVDLGIRHFDAARLYGLGQVEAELGALLRRHSGQLTVATKCGLGEVHPPSGAVQRQGELRRLLQLAPGLRPLARRFYGSRMVRRDFSAAHCRRSLETSLGQLALEPVDLLLLHEPGPTDAVDPAMEACLQDWQRQGLIGGYGISGLPDLTVSLWRQRPGLAPHILQWEDDLLEPQPLVQFSAAKAPMLRGRFGRIRRSLQPIQLAFEAVPQLQRHWSERLNLDLAVSDALVAALLGAALAAHPGDLLLFASTDPVRLRRIVSLLHAPPWDAAEAIAFEHFWRPPADPATSPCP
jgi:diketogulonate reductase-like aldo/keto reductase